MPDRNRAVHVRELDAGSAASQFPVQVMAYPPMVMDLQAEIIANRAMHGRGFQFRLDVGRHSQTHTAIDR